MYKEEPRNNCLVKKIPQLKLELRSLRKQYRKANEAEKTPLSDLQDILRNKLKTEGAEGHRKYSKRKV